MLILFRTILFIGIFSTIVLTEKDVHVAMPVGSDIETAAGFLSGLDEGRIIEVVRVISVSVS